MKQPGGDLATPEKTMAEQIASSCELGQVVFVVSPALIISNNV